LSLADTGVHVFVSLATGVQLSPRITPLAVTVAEPDIEAEPACLTDAIAVTVATHKTLATPSATIPPFAVNTVLVVIEALPS
jgi:hypothetical protein